jgi:hypothetical protein
VLASEGRRPRSWGNSSCSSPAWRPSIPTRLGACSRTPPHRALLPRLDWGPARQQRPRCPRGSRCTSFCLH